VSDDIFNFVMSRKCRRSWTVFQNIIFICISSRDLS